MLARKVTIFSFIFAMLAGCSTFNDEIYVIIGEGSQIMAINSGSKKASGEKGLHPDSQNTLGSEGFECTFKSTGEKPSIFSTKIYKQASLRCEKLKGKL